MNVSTVKKNLSDPNWRSKLLEASDNDSKLATVLEQGAIFTDDWTDFDFSDDPELAEMMETIFTSIGVYADNYLSTKNVPDAAAKKKRTTQRRKKPAPQPTQKATTAEKPKERKKPAPQPTKRKPASTTKAKPESAKRKPASTTKAKPATKQPKLTLAESYLVQFQRMNYKVYTLDSIIRLLNRLQRDIKEKNIRKTDPRAEQIVQMQDGLIRAARSAERNGAVEIRFKAAPLNGMRIHKNKG